MQLLGSRSPSHGLGRLSLAFLFHVCWSVEVQVSDDGGQHLPEGDALLRSARSWGHMLKRQDAEAWVEKLARRGLAEEPAAGEEESTTHSPTESTKEKRNRARKTAKDKKTERKAEPNRKPDFAPRGNAKEAVQTKKQEVKEKIEKKQDNAKLVVVGVVLCLLLAVGGAVAVLKSKKAPEPEPPPPEPAPPPVEEFAPDASDEEDAGEEEEEGDDPDEWKFLDGEGEEAPDGEANAKFSESQAEAGQEKAGA